MAALVTSSAGEIMAIMVVLQFPPRLSSNIRVSLESLYGMCCRDFESGTGENERIEKEKKEKSNGVERIREDKTE